MKGEKFILAVWNVLLLSALTACDDGVKLPPAPGEEPSEPEFVFEPQVEIPWRGLANSPWPMYLHDPQHTGRSPYVGPDSGVVVWAVDLGAEIFSSPAIGEDGTIYVGTSEPGNSFYAISADGAVKWRVQTGGVVHSSPLISAEGTVYFGSNDRRLYAVTADGQVLWKVPTGGFFGPSSPTISRDGELIYAQVGVGHEAGHPAGRDAVLAIDRRGNVVWRFEPPASEGDLIQFSPALSPDGAVLYAPGWKGLFAISARDGRLLWFTPFEGPASTPSVGNQGNIYLRTPRAVVSLAADGGVRWVRDTWGTNFRYSAVSIREDGGLVVEDLKTVRTYDVMGSEIWSFDVKRFDNVVMTTVIPALDRGGAVYFGLVVFDRGLDVRTL